MLPEFNPSHLNVSVKRRSTVWSVFCEKAGIKKCDIEFLLWYAQRNYSFETEIFATMKP